MDGIADLITSPFHDVVEKSKSAVENAGDGQQMLKAAKSLLKEGERALKRIEPLCQRRFHEYGSRFVTALKGNDELARYRKQLNDLLWEFDDYIVAEDFDADKFAELQALSRDTAPKIYDLLLTIKVDAATPQLSSGLGSGTAAFMSHPSPPLSPDSIAAPKFPHAPPVPARSVSRLFRDSSSSSGWTDSGSLGGIRTVNMELGHMVNGIDESRAMGPEASSNHRHNSWASRRSLLVSPLPPEIEEEPPRPPSTNPWDIDSVVMTGDGQFRFHEAASFVRRPLVEPPAETKLVDSPPASPPTTPFPPQSDVSSLRLQPRDDHDRPGTSVSFQSHDGGESHRSFDNESENGASIDPSKKTRKPRKSKTARINYTIFPTTKKKAVVTEQEVNHHLSVGSTNASDAAGPYTALDRAPSIVESLVDPDLPPIRESIVYHQSTATDLPGPSQSQSHTGSRSARAPSTSRADADHISLAPVDTAPHVAVSTKDCIIDETSSFYVHKGFCAGALEVFDGGIGIKKAKKTGSLSSTLIVARCKSCMYEFDFKQLEFDLRKLDEGNFVKNGIGHRLRFLQKSHLATKKVNDIKYGCVFCHRLGRTLDVSDATVFNTTTALFKHLARHPRPLPEVPGISVVDQEEVPADLLNDYDLHFRNPPEQHPAHEQAAQLAHLPTAVAKEDLRKHNASSRPPDEGPVLDVSEGAKIVGITWPDRYQGDWCMGWHDGVHAALPSEIVKLDRPDGENYVHAYDPMSHTQARARLKFAPKEKGWLRFDKDELIRNISYAGSHNDHWCWSGTNAKGKSGIFPQAFIDINTLQEDEHHQQPQHHHHNHHHDHDQVEYEVPPSRRSERGSIFGGSNSGGGGDESARTSSILGQLSVRGRSRRSSSIAQSISSSESRKKLSSFLSRRS